MERLHFRTLAAMAATLILLAAPETRGGEPYLTQTGPSPLRFGLISAIPASFILPVSLVERQAPTNTTEAAITSTTSTETNAVATQPSPTAVPTANPTLPTTPSPQITSTPKPPASDLLVVSPQMLTEYFKPVGDGTNSPGAVIVPVPIGFTPPSATPPSRATYNNP